MWFRSSRLSLDPLTKPNFLQRARRKTDPGTTGFIGWVEVDDEESERMSMPGGWPSAESKPALHPVEDSPNSCASAPKTLNVTQERAQTAPALYTVEEEHSGSIGLEPVNLNICQSPLHLNQGCSSDVLDGQSTEGSDVSDDKFYTPAGSSIVLAGPIPEEPSHLPHDDHVGVQGISLVERVSSEDWVRVSDSDLASHCSEETLYDRDISNDVPRRQELVITIPTKTFPTHEAPQHSPRKQFMAPAVSRIRSTSTFGTPSPVSPALRSTKKVNVFDFKLDALTRKEDTEKVTSPFSGSRGLFFDTSPNVSIRGEGYRRRRVSSVPIRSTYSVEDFAAAELLNRPDSDQKAPKKALDIVTEKLDISRNAAYDATANISRGPCAPGTGTEILKLIDWCNSTEKALYWMSGREGSGKTTIAYSLSRTLDGVKLLGASFFCSRLLPDCRDLKLILPTVAVQLAQKYPAFADSLASRLKEYPNICQSSLDAQLQKLIIEPWKARKAELPGNTIVILDALDECDGDHATFLDILFASSSELPFKALITSKLEFLTREASRAQHPDTLSTSVFHELEDETLRADIFKFLQVQLCHHTTPDTIHFVANLAGPSFLYAVTLAKLVISDNVNIIALLRALQEPSAIWDGSKMRPSLDALYTEVMEYIFCEDLSEAEKQEIRDILHTVVYIREPLTRQAMAELWDIQEEEVNRRLDRLGSVLSLPQDRNLPITVLHTSFAEFILDPSRSGKYACVSLDLQLTRQCLAILDNKLQQNLCQVEDRPPNNRIHSRVIDTHISAGLRYAATHFMEHWAMSDPQHAFRFVRRFLTVHLFSWFECLSLVGKLRVSVQGLEMTLKGLHEDAHLARLAQDGLRFIQQVYDLIESNALETYSTALFWVPVYSPLRIHYAALFKRAPQALCGLPTEWAESEQKAETPSLTGSAIHITTPAKAKSMAFSSNGRKVLLLPSLRILKTAEAEETARLHPRRGVNYICGALSTSGNRVAAAAGRVIDLWELKGDNGIEGNPLSLEGHVKDVVSLSFSYDERLLASASGVITRVWDASTGDPIHVLNHPSSSYNWVHHIAFSYDGVRLVSLTSYTAYIWNTRSGKQLHKFSTDARSIAFAPDDSLIITSPEANGTATVGIWNTETYKLERQYTGYHCWTTLDDGSSYAFHDDGWLYQFIRFNSLPRRLLWIPSSYRPFGPRSGLSSQDHTHTNGPLVTSSSSGTQVCLPQKDGLITLLLPRGRRY